MPALTQLVLASHNAKKLAELRRVLAAAGLETEVLGLDECASYPEPAETERTFSGNASIKAEVGALHTGLPTLADDSGICVDELNGMPGVRSARWAGPACDDQANLQLLLDQMADVATERRSAQFRCVVALAIPGEPTKTWSGVMPGRLAEAPCGDGGFGYDPIFIPDGMELTTAQLSPEAKDALSHRGQALRSFVEWLRS